MTNLGVLLTVLFLIPALGAAQTERDHDHGAAGVAHADWSAGAYFGEPSWIEWLRGEFPDARALAEDGGRRLRACRRCGRLSLNGAVPDELDNPDIRWFTGEFSAPTPAAPKDEEHRAYPGLQIEVAPLHAGGDPFGDGCSVKYFREGRRYVVDCG